MTSFSNLERFSTDSQTISPHEIARRRKEEKDRKKSRRAGRLMMAFLGVAAAVVASSALTRKHQSPLETRLKAALVAKERATSNPNVVIEPYIIGTDPQDVMLSEVAANLHPLSTDGAQDAIGQILALKTYLTPEQRQLEAFSPGDEIDVAIDKSSGHILPHQEAINSEPWAR